MTKRFEGKVAFVTGAARGQGRNHAIRLAKEGAHIIAVDLCAQVDSVAYTMSSRDDLAITVKEVESHGGRIVATQADIRDYTALAKAVNEGVAQFGRLDIVSANAGICSYGAGEELPEQKWQDMIDINLTGAWHTAKATIPHLVTAGGGAIVFTASAAGQRPYPNCAHYVASKHGVLGLMKALAVELADRNIRVNAINPTTVATEMILNDYSYQYFRPDLESPGVEDAKPGLAGWNALPVPWVDSDDVTNALMYLASDEGRYVTGVALPVDAGCVVK
ncbi:mycofactocin-coupled SDR family oxidoreductase [Rhodococcus opacus]|uniref:mycofactocin-coupled SDR family oxidoreductase n=1 Tax=Rhodococcus opacus TaxID=37919 RepID=UPI002474ABA4|nr:mycofactocin-coupled SDR family oxidoreductase [Rhodococcus opacus]MDH6292850.1 (+)-trans-carveol dehydrogenase [Rhodococcus opacus]